jgi:N6-L-threonylcarbamoyladenine synthase
MMILGIETSCDETAAAVVEDGTRVLSNVIASQIPLHEKTGGVVPEVAAREHVIKITPVIEESMKEAGLTWNDIDAIAYTQGPGLLSSLIMGATSANILASTLNKPLIPVNHISGHIYANWLGEDEKKPIEFPIVVLTVSGGHNEIVLMNSHAQYELIGETLDDAAGEAFDKVARLLGLGYPGGPYISRAADKAYEKNSLAELASKFKLPIVYIDKDTLNFSFSGLKTAVLNLVEEEHKRSGRLSEDFINGCAAAFQESVCTVLSDKLLRAADAFKVKEVHLAGGVSANKRLRQMTEEKISAGFYYNFSKKIKLGVKPRFRFAAQLSYCTDNAAMIAAAAYFHYLKNTNAYKKISGGLADPNLNLYHSV